MSSRRQIAELPTIFAGKFTTGDTVSVTVYRDASSTALTLTSSATTEIGATGYFRWSSSNIASGDRPSAGTESNYLVLFASSTLEKPREFSLGGYPDEIDGPISDVATQASVDLLKYGGAIHIDTINGTSGAVLGTNGTQTNPVNNIAHAVTLAAALGVRTYSVAGSITLASSHTNWVFAGASGTAQGLGTVDAGGQDVGGSHFMCLNLTGDFAGSSIAAHSCNLVADLDNIEGSFRGCVLVPGGTNTFTMAANATVGLYDCRSRFVGSATATIDLSNHTTGGELHVRAYSGGLSLDGCTAALFNSSIEHLVGQVVVHATNTAGSTTLRGNSKVTNNTGGMTVVNETILSQIGFQGGQVWVDTVNGTAGTDYPVGTASSPVLTYADAITIATANGLTRMMLAEGSTIALTNNHDGWEFTGGQIVLNGESCDETRFTDTWVVGSASGGSIHMLRGAITYDGGGSIADITMFEGQLAGNQTFPNACTINLVRCTSLPGTTSLCVVTAGRFYAYDFAGQMSLQAVGGQHEVSMAGGTFNLNGLSGGGTVALSGYGVRTGLSPTNMIGWLANGTQIFADEAVWFSSTGSSGTAYPAGTLGSPVNNIADAETIAAANGLRKLYVRGNLILTAGLTYFDYVVGVGEIRTITVGGTAVLQAQGIDLNIVGASTGTIEGGPYNRCTIAPLTGCTLGGTFIHCEVTDPLSLDPVVTPGSKLVMLDCYGELSLDVTGMNLFDLDMVGWRGEANLTGCAFPGNIIDLNLDGGVFTSDSGNTDGTIAVKGDGIFTDAGGGITIVDNRSAGLTAAAVWDAIITNHDSSQLTMAGSLLRLYDRNSRTRSFYSDGIITGGREVPAGALSHIEVQLKAEDAADWTVAVTKYIVFNYNVGDSSTDAPRASEATDSAPVDGNPTFTAGAYP